MAAQVAGNQLDKYAERKGYGVGGAQKAEEMARLRAMRKTAKAGEGLYRAMHKAGIKNPKQKMKEVGKATAKVASRMAGDAVTAYTGNPMLGDSVARIADETAERMIDKGVKSGLSHGATLSTREAKRMGVEAVDSYIDANLPPSQREVVENALAGKYKNAQDLIYDVGDKVFNTQVQQPQEQSQTRMNYNLFSGMTGRGLGRPRGRPRKDMIGAGVRMSSAYKKALKANYSKLELNNVTSENKPISQFTVNPRVKPSSYEMTLSPYLSNSSPAMNPFVPSNYYQEGGQMRGYGGKGLYMPSGKGLY